MSADFDNPENEKRFEIRPSFTLNDSYVIDDSEKEYTFPALDSTLNYMFCKALNEQDDRIQKLESENKMLKTTIGRNEAEIDRLKHKGEWDNTSDDGIEWLRNNTIWEIMPTNKRTYTRTD